VLLFVVFFSPAAPPQRKKICTKARPLTPSSGLYDSSLSGGLLDFRQQDPRGLWQTLVKWRLGSRHRTINYFFHLGGPICQYKEKSIATATSAANMKSVGANVPAVLAFVSAEPLPPYSLPSPLLFPCDPMPACSRSKTEGIRKKSCFAIK